LSIKNFLRDVKHTNIFVHVSKTKITQAAITMMGYWTACMHYTVYPSRLWKVRFKKF